MRLDKVIEQQLNTSRKEMKRLFQQGKVFVDHRIERRPERNVDSSLHQIMVAGRQLETQERYYIVNKPKGVVTANLDQQHQTVNALIAPEDQHPDLYAVGRLDRDTEGLVLVTTNGQLGYDLLHPTKKVTKRYEVVVNDLVPGGVTCKPAALTIIDARADHSFVSLEIAEGKFHQVKKMFLARGKKVIQLKRTAMGSLVLPDDLAVGSYRSLTQEELKGLAAHFR